MFYLHRVENASVAVDADEEVVPLHEIAEGGLRIVGHSHASLLLEQPNRQSGSQFADSRAVMEECDFGRLQSVVADVRPD